MVQVVGGEWSVKLNLNPFDAGNPMGLKDAAVVAAKS